MAGMGEIGDIDLPGLGADDFDVGVPDMSDFVAGFDLGADEV